MIKKSTAAQDFVKEVEGKYKTILAGDHGYSC